MKANIEMIGDETLPKIKIPNTNANEATRNYLVKLDNMREEGSHKETTNEEGDEPFIVVNNKRRISPEKREEKRRNLRNTPEKWAEKLENHITGVNNEDETESEEDESEGEEGKSDEEKEDEERDSNKDESKHL